MTEPIKVTEDNYPGCSGGYTEEHSAFGMIGISRCASSGTTLFGSEVRHQHFVCLRVKKGEVKHDLNHEWFHGSAKDLLEVWMTEAQFAQMITSLNIGDGVPCTLRNVDGKEFELPPQSRSIISRFNQSLDGHVEKIRKDSTDALKQVQAMRSGEVKLTKAELTKLEGDLHSLQQNLNSNLKFLQDSLQERMEATVQKAVTEFEAHVNASLQQRGLEALKSQMPLLSVHNAADNDHDHGQLTRESEG